MISIIIPTKELNEYLFETICNYKLSIKCEYEIIVVYDIESKECHEKFLTRFNNDDSIIIVLSPDSGRINALNIGFSHSKGDIIKCIDADDILLGEYFEKLEIIKNYSAHCHNANLINNNNEIIGTYIFDSNILFKSYDYVLTNLKSPPRWVWSFNRKIARLIFPIPPKLFAEDIWFSLIIKKYCDKIYHLNSSVYSYRQHGGSEWGGLKNFSHDIMTRRAKWNLTLIPVLLENKSLLGIVVDDIFSNIINYYKVILSNKSLFNILCAETTNYYKTKLLIIMYFPKIASLLIHLKWKYSHLIISYINYYYKIRKLNI